MNMVWKQMSPTSWLFYNEEDGKIHGKIMSPMGMQVFTCFWQNMSLGEYMSLEQAKKAIEDPSNKTKLQDLMASISNSVKP